MEALLYWGIGLWAVALLLFAIEVIVPSGGVIGGVSFLCAASGVGAFWTASPTWGIVSGLVLLLLVPCCAWFAVRVMPETALGRRMMLEEDEDQMQMRALEAAEQREREQALVGAEGVALQDLRPVGLAKIEGAKIEVLAAAGYVEAGTPVRVVSVEGNQIKVRALS